MMDFGWHAVRIIWNKDDESVFKTLPDRLPFKIEWNKYAEGTCLCQYEEDTLRFWNKEKVNSCSGACANQQGAYAVLEDVQYEAYDAKSHRLFYTFEQVLNKMNYQVLLVKPFPGPNGKMETFTRDIVYNRVNLQGKQKHKTDFRRIS